MALSVLRLLVALQLVQRISSHCAADQDSCSCWERCFRNPKQKYVEAFQNISRVVAALNDLYLPCSKPRGIVFAVDSESSSFNGLDANKIMAFKMNLVAIMAISQQDKEKSNPLFFNKVFRNVAFTVKPDWFCLDSCDMVKAMSIEYARWNTTKYGNINAGLVCDLTRHSLFGNHTACKDAIQEPLLVLITDSRLEMVDECNSLPAPRRLLLRLGLNTNHAIDSRSRPFGNAHLLKLGADLNHLEASNYLVKCIQNSCCTKAGSKHFNEWQNEFDILDPEDLAKRVAPPEGRKLEAERYDTRTRKYKMMKNIKEKELRSMIGLKL